MSTEPALNLNVVERISKEFNQTFEAHLVDLDRCDFDYGFNDKKMEELTKRNHAIANFGSSFKLNFSLDNKQQLKFDKNRAAILDYTKRNPSWSYLKIAAEMNTSGFSTTPAKIRNVWKNSGLNSRLKRFEWVLGLVKFHNLKISPVEHLKVVKFIERNRRVHVAPPSYEGEVLAHKLFHLGNINGLGNMYLHVWYDLWSKTGFIHPTKSKIAEVPFEYLMTKIVPHYSMEKIMVKTIVTDGSRELFGKQNLYSVTLKMFEIAQVVDYGQKSQPIIELKEYYQKILEILKSKGVFGAGYNTTKELSIVMHTFIYENGLLSLSDQNDELKNILEQFYYLDNELVRRLAV